MQLITNPENFSRYARLLTDLSCSQVTAAARLPQWTVALLANSQRYHILFLLKNPSKILIVLSNSKFTILYKEQQNANIAFRIYIGNIVYKITF